jgi:hypothetical protein
MTLFSAEWHDQLIVTVCVMLVLVMFWLGMNGPGPGQRGWFVGD